VKKIPTIFVRDWEGTLGPPARFVTTEPHPDCAWVFAGEGVATRKYDGSACLIVGGRFYKRHEVRPGKVEPEGFVEVEYDEETGKQIGWVPVGDGPEDRWHHEALATNPELVSLDGTYELVGPKVQGNPEGFEQHALVRHSDAEQLLGVLLTYDGVREFLEGTNVEGIVWDHPDGRMAKIKGKDFGIKREGARA
jgi:hypothetical protein